MSDFKESIKWYKETIRLDPQGTDGYCGMGECFLDLRDYNQAISWYRQAIAKDTKNTKAYYGLGRVYEGLGNYDEAIELFTEVIKIELKAYGGYDSVARIYAKKGKYAEAIKFYEKSIENDYLVVCNYTDLGLLYKKLGKAREAEENFLMVVKIEPNNYIGYYNLTRYYYEIGNLALAMQNAKKALSLVMNPFDKIKDLELKGFILVMQENYPQAEKIFNSLIKEHGASCAILAGLGHIAYAKKNYQSARRYFEDALRQPDIDLADPDPADGKASTLVGLGWVNANEHKYKEAVACYEKILKEKPFYIFALISMGEAYNQLEEYAKAEECFKRAMFINPGARGLLKKMR